MRKRVLIVAGSDSGGGAGIQADVKAVTCLGAYAATAITALTAQNTLGVHGVFSVEPAFVVRQIEVVLDDIGADAIKTGMLGSAAVVRAVADVLARLARGVPLVVDPVMFAKGGAELLEADAVTAVRELLVPHAAVVTPNLPEAQALVGFEIAGVEAMRRAGEALLDLGAHAAFVKGGHSAGDIVRDVLVTRSGVETFENPRIPTRSTHGTGCTLASAIAAGLASGLDTFRAVSRARRYVQRALETAPGLGRGHGPLGHGHTVRDFD